MWDFCGIVGDKGELVLVDGDKMPGARFFPDATLNFAENLLKKTGPGRRHRVPRRGQGRAPAVVERAACADLAAAAAFPVARREQGRPRRGDDAQHAGDGRRHAGRRLDRRRLVVLLARFRRAGRARPVRPDRARQSSSRRDGYWYNGKAIEVADKVAAVAAKLGTRPQGPRRRLSRHADATWRATIDKARGAGRGAGAVRRQARRASSGCRSRIRSTSCSRRARPACRNASSIRPAARCSSTVKEHRLHCRPRRRRPRLLFHHAAAG